MTPYNLECLIEYQKALSKAERIMKAGEHDVWMTEGVTNALYNISLTAREQLNIINQELSQIILEEQNKEK
jgi:hypothetical protein